MSIRRRRRRERERRGSKVFLMHLTGSGKKLGVGVLSAGFKSELRYLLAVKNNGINCLAF